MTLGGMDTGPRTGATGRRITARVAVMAALAVWVALALAAVLLSGAGPDGTRVLLGFLALSLALLVPLASWTLWRFLHAAGALREAVTALRGATETMDHARMQLRQAHAATPRPELEGRLGDILARLDAIEQGLAAAGPLGTVAPLRHDPGAAAAPGPEADAEPQGQGRFALRGEPPPPVPVPPAEIVRALNFPEDENDTDGFRSLRRALADHEVARLIRAAQDILTLLSQEGVYTDDLVPDRARPEIWRSFAAGQRGREIAPLGGIRDREALAAVSTRMKLDPVFRDAAHHFLRQFDRTFAAFADKAADEDIIRFSDTRTARAFMLLGRAMGIFS